MLFGYLILSIILLIIYYRIQNSMKLVSSIGKLFLLILMVLYIPAFNESGFIFNLFNLNQYSEYSSLISLFNLFIIVMVIMKSLKIKRTD